MPWHYTQLKIAPGSRGGQVVRADIISYGGGLSSTTICSLDRDNKIRGDRILFTQRSKSDTAESTDLKPVEILLEGRI
jgi:hypothetical protein